MNRNLDGVYFRVNRENEWENVCFSDLTTEERDVVLCDKDEVWLKSLCRAMADSLKRLGDQMNIVCE